MAMVQGLVASNSTQGPQSDISMMGKGGGVPTEVHISYPKKFQLQNLSTKNTLLF